MLVCAYFPVILATVKAGVLIVLGETLRHVNVPVSVRDIVYLLSCYIDLNRQRTERFEQGSHKMFLQWYTHEREYRINNVQGTFAHC